MTYQVKTFHGDFVSVVSILLIRETLEQYLCLESFLKLPLYSFHKVVSVTDLYLHCYTS